MGAKTQMRKREKKKKKEKKKKSTLGIARGI